MTTFKEIIDEIGIAPLAALLSVEESHVRTMKTRDSIPPEYWGLILDEVRRRGVDGLSFDALRQMRTERFSRTDDARLEVRAAE
jgi:hypothetical protein